MPYARPYTQFGCGCGWWGRRFAHLWHLVAVDCDMQQCPEVRSALFLLCCCAFAALLFQACCGVRVLVFGVVCRRERRWQLLTSPIPMSYSCVPHLWARRCNQQILRSTTRTQTARMMPAEKPASVCSPPHTNT